jgi:hypothetical protein
MNDDEEKGWHFKKEVQLGHLITTFTIAISAVVYINKIEERVSIVEAQITNQKETGILFRMQLEKINDKLDRLIERGQK